MSTDPTATDHRAGNDPNPPAQPSAAVSETAADGQGDVCVVDDCYRTPDQRGLCKGH